MQLQLYQVFLVAHSDGIPIRRPSDVDVFAYKEHFTSDLLNMMNIQSKEPLVLTVAMLFFILASQTLIVLSPLAVLSRSELVSCQQSWSTLSVWPTKV